MIDMLQATKGTIVRIAGICITLAAACVTRSALQQDYGVYGALAGCGVVLVGITTTTLIAAKIDELPYIGDHIRSNDVEMAGLLPADIDRDII